jgi:hypothetical protein
MLLKEFTDFALQGWFYWTAIEQNGLALQYAPEHIRNNPYICWAAMKNNVAAVQFIGEKLQSVKFYKNVVDTQNSMDIVLLHILAHLIY